MKDDKELVINDDDEKSHHDMFRLVDTDSIEEIGQDIFIKDIPILPIRNNTLFPGVVMPVQTSRKRSVAVVKKAYKNSQFIVTMTQKRPGDDSPGLDDLYTYGTLSRVVKVYDLHDGNTSVILQGLCRVKVVAAGKKSDLSAVFERKFDLFPDKDDKEFPAVIDSVKDLAVKIIAMSSNVPDETDIAVKNIESPGFLIGFVSTNLEFSTVDKAGLLGIDSVKERGLALIGSLSDEIQKLKLRGDIQNKVKKELDKQQRDYFLNQQIKTIQNELGGDPSSEELTRLENAAAQKQWPQNVAETFQKELNRLKVINPQSPDYSVQLVYLQTIIDLPWNFCTEDDFDMKTAEKILNEEHYGIEKVKERILEYLAVLKIKGNLKSPILCLYGPPGVGKTSLGRSIAHALNRKYVRVSLGGLSDEAEIRGHRKTYIGAMPGRIIHNIKKAGSSNPVFVLDEIDKVGKDFRGDPSSALLEVLDPEQNFEFHDNYLDLDYDLSNVMFIATANNIGEINPALLDRMELINVSGYVAEEKVEIAKRHLIPKVLGDHGLTSSQIKLSPKIVRTIIDSYTRESGVRELNNKIASVARKIASKVAFSKEYNINVSAKDLNEYLGMPVYMHEEYNVGSLPGVVVGLAWTAAGGEILYVESSLSRGSGGLTLTGNLGNVMKESAEIALQYVKSNAKALNINYLAFKVYNVHLHVPEGAIPKDGPSAGITMFTCFASLFTQRAVKSHIAMTGELTLSGRVLPVGGIKEKILAAKRAGVKTVFMSIENKRDIEEINELYIKGLEFVYISQAMELIPLVLEELRVENPVPMPGNKPKPTKE